MIGKHVPIVQSVLITGSHCKNIFGYKIDADWLLQRCEDSCKECDLVVLFGNVGYLLRDNQIDVAAEAIL